MIRPIPTSYIDMNPANDGAERQLPVVFDVSHIHPTLMKSIQRKIDEAVSQVVGPVADENGQLVMFPELNEKQNVPQSIASQVRQSVMAALSGSGIDIAIGESFKIVNKYERDDAFQELGYGFA